MRFAHRGDHSHFGALGRDHTFAVSPPGAIRVPDYVLENELPRPIFSGKAEDWIGFKMNFELFLSSRQAFTVPRQSRLLLGSLQGALSTEFATRYKAAKGFWFSLIQYWQQLDERFSADNEFEFEADPESYIRAHPWDGNEWSLVDFSTQVAERCCQFNGGNVELAKSQAAKMIFLRGLPPTLLQELNRKIRADPSLSQMSSDIEMLCSEIHDLVDEFKSCRLEIPWKRGSSAKIFGNSEEKPLSSNVPRVLSLDSRGTGPKWPRDGSPERKSRLDRGGQRRDNSDSYSRADAGERGRNRSPRREGTSPVRQFHDSQSPTRRQYSSTAPTPSGRPLSCYNCGGTGHFKNKCPRASENKGLNTNFSRGSLENAEIHRVGTCQKNGLSNLSSELQNDDDDEEFFEGHSRNFSDGSDEAFRSFDVNESNQSVRTFQGASPQESLKD